MRITATADIALRATLELALAPAGVFVPVGAIAGPQAMSPTFLVAILHDLRRAGLVDSRRGSDGGYRLARPPEAIALADVIRAVEGPLLTVRGEAPEDLVYAEPAVALREVWLALQTSVRTVVEQVTIADIAAGRLPSVWSEHQQVG